MMSAIINLGAAHSALDTVFRSGGVWYLSQG